MQSILGREALRQRDRELADRSWRGRPWGGQFGLGRLQQSGESGNASVLRLERRGRQRDSVSACFLLNRRWMCELDLERKSMPRYRGSGLPFPRGRSVVC
jgi:hypothetical protein